MALQCKNTQSLYSQNTVILSQMLSQILSQILVNTQSNTHLPIPECQVLHLTSPRADDVPAHAALSHTPAAAAGYVLQSPEGLHSLRAGHLSKHPSEDLQSEQ